MEEFAQAEEKSQDITTKRRLPVKLFDEHQGIAQLGSVNLEEDKPTELIVTDLISPDKRGAINF